MIQMQNWIQMRYIEYTQIYNLYYKLLPRYDILSYSTPGSTPTPTSISADVISLVSRHHIQAPGVNRDNYESDSRYVYTPKIGIQKYHGSSIIRCIHLSIYRLVKKEREKKTSKLTNLSLDRLHSYFGMHLPCLYMTTQCLMHWNSIRSCR